MKKFVVLYHASPEAMAKMAEATEAEKVEGMKPWLAWKDALGNKLVDFGAPLTSGTRLLPDGSTEMSKKDVAGYSMIQASDMEEAKALLKDHPHLKWTGGCDIEVHECVPM